MASYWPQLAPYLGIAPQACACGLLPGVTHMAKHTRKPVTVAPTATPAQAPVLLLPAPAPATVAAALATLRASMGAPAAPPPPVVTPLAPVAMGRGAATQARWAACGKGVAGFAVTMPAAIKALPATTLLTCNVAQNPKVARSTSAAAFACYGFTAVGQQTTLGQFAAALTKAGLGGATQAAGHVAWDFNHGFIKIG